MSRPVLLILMLLISWWWLSRLETRSSRSSGQSQTASDGQGSAKRPTEPEASQSIEQCAVYDVHAPRTGMVVLVNGCYRCPEHADWGNVRHPKRRVPREPRHPARVACSRV